MEAKVNKQSKALQKTALTKAAPKRSVFYKAGKALADGVKKIINDERRIGRDIRNVQKAFSQTMVGQAMHNTAQKFYKGVLKAEKGMLKGLPVLGNLLKAARDFNKGIESGTDLPDISKAYRMTPVHHAQSTIKVAAMEDKTKDLPQQNIVETVAKTAAHAKTPVLQTTVKSSPMAEKSGKQAIAHVNMSKMPAKAIGRGR